MAILFIVYLYFDRKDRKEKEKIELEERKKEREAKRKSGQRKIGKLLYITALICLRWGLLPLQ